MLRPLFYKLKTSVMNPVLLFNDLHVSKDSVLEFKKNWDEMLSVCKKYDVDTVFIGGDLFDSPTVQVNSVMAAVDECFADAQKQGVVIHIAPGNHDLPDRKLTDSWCDRFHYVATVHKQPYLYELDLGLWLAMFPYYLEDSVFPKVIGDFESSLSAKGIDKGDVILYLHAGIHGALGDFDVPNELPQEILAGYHKVLCGHYHNRVHIKGTKVYYIGASRAHNFGEDEDKGYTLLYSDGETEFIKNKVNTRYVTEHLKLSELKNWKSYYDELYKVRLIVHCKSNEVELVNKQELIDRGASKIDFNTEKIQAIKAEQSGVDEKFDTKDLQQEYKNFCSEKDIDGRMGIDYLNKID